MSEEKNDRVVTYLSPVVAKWLRKEAEKMGFTESSYLRFLIMKEKHTSKGQ
jgi:hypothetical protein